MIILLTSGTGYVGSHTAISVAARGHNVMLIDNRSNSRKTVASLVAMIAKKPCALDIVGISDADLVTNVMSEYNKDCAMHFAGLKSVSESIANPSDYYSNNVHGRPVDSRYPMK